MVVRLWLASRDVGTLGAGPRTVFVSADNAIAFWDARKSWFFKPATGQGAKAVYRGDKLTRGVWEDILAGIYVAQELVPRESARSCWMRQQRPAS